MGIGNPGSYGGENDCDKLNDDLDGEALNYGDPLYSPEDLIGMLPIGGVGGKLGKLGKLGRKLIGKPFPTKTGSMGRQQPHKNGKYLPFEANPGIKHSPLANISASFAQGVGESTGVSGGYTPVGFWANVAHTLGKLYGSSL